MNNTVMKNLPVSVRMEMDPDGCYQIRDPVYAECPLEAMAKIFWQLYQTDKNRIPKGELAA